MAELLITLAISVALLAAAATAFSASSAAVEHNDRFSRATQAARVTMNQMLAEIRRADSVLVTGTTQVEVIRPVPSRTANEVSRTYRYDAATQTILLKITYLSGQPAVEHPLASNVSAAMFGPAETGTASAGQAAIVRVPVSVTVSIKESQVTLNGAAAPRRAQN
jgi:hypothetical protein